MIGIRPFREKDWGVLLDLADQAEPLTPDENVEWLELRKAFDESRRLRRHYIATDGGLPVGYGCLEQQSDDPQRLRVFVVCSPANLSKAGSHLYDQLLQDAEELGAAHLWAREYQGNEPVREFLAVRGFVEVQRFTLPDQPSMVVYTLDLAG